MISTQTLGSHGLPSGLVFRPELPAHWEGVGVWLSTSGFQDDLPSSDWVGAQYGFNVGLHVGDAAGEVNRRRLALQQFVGRPILWLNQVHGCEVLEAPLKEALTVPEADASLTLNAGCVLAVMTADCLPAVLVVFEAEQNRPLAVGVVHAGWKGLRAGVLQACVAQLKKAVHQVYGCADEMVRVECFLGPAIGPDSFEVGVEVKASFLSMDARAERCFKPHLTQPNKHWADLYGLAELVLGVCEVQVVYGGGLDTMTDARWFSHRRSMQTIKQDSGRFVTLVGLF